MMLIFKILAFAALFSALQLSNAEETNRSRRTSSSSATAFASSLSSMSDSASARLQGPATIGRNQASNVDTNVAKIPDDTISNNKPQLSRLKPTTTASTVLPPQISPPLQSSSSNEDEPIDERPTVASSAAARRNHRKPSRTSHKKQQYETNDDCIEDDDSDDGRIYRNAYDQNYAYEMVARPMFAFRSMFDNVMGQFGSSFDGKLQTKYYLEIKRNKKTNLNDLHLLFRTKL